MDISNKKSLATTLLLIVIFISIFTFARAIVSVGVVILILAYVIYRDRSLKLFKEYLLFWFLLIMGIFFCMSVIYSTYYNGFSDLKSLVAFSNPMLLLLFSFSVINFLYGQRKNVEFILNFVCLLTIILSLIGLIVCGYQYLFYSNYNFLVTNIYHQQSAQFFIGFIFPFISVVLISKAFEVKRRALKTLLFICAVIVIFVDVMGNRSMIGWLNEAIVFCYYLFKILSRYSHKDNVLSWSRLSAILLAGLIFFTVAFTSAYNLSPTIKAKVDISTVSLKKLFDRGYNQKNKGFLENTSTGLRSLYYISSIKVMKEYPRVLILGCPGIGYSMNIIDCTHALIAKSEKLSNDNMVVSEIFPHDEFINLTFKSGIVGGVFLFLFLFSLFFFAAKKLEIKYKIYLRILVAVFTTGCLFDFFMSSQLITVSFFTLLAILLATQGNKPNMLEE